MKHLGGVLVVSAVSIAAMGASATRGEQAMAKSWADANLSAKAAPVFSFLLDGKPSRQILTGWKVAESVRRGPSGRTTRVVSYSDKGSGLVVRCERTLFASSSAVEWVVFVENTGARPSGMIEQLRPMDARFDLAPTAPFVLERSAGDGNSEGSFQPTTEALKGGDERVYAPAGGRSSEPFLPFYNLDMGGKGAVLAIGWSGQWEAKFARAASGEVSVKVGQQLTHFRLQPGEKVRTPRMLMVFWDGKDALRGNNLLRQLLLKEYMPKRDGKPVVAPICASVNWTDPDGSYEGPHLSVMPIYSRLGVEVFWSDMDPQHWYPVGFSAGTGNYSVDKAKYPHGLEPIGDAAKKAGLQYLLWFEPERVHPGTETDRQHPEWILKSQGAWSQLLDFGNPAAAAWMTDLLDGFVKRLHLSWLRWDFNIQPLGFWRTADAPDRQGISENRYITALYKMWDELRERNPGLVIDLCASGGRRIDIESLSRGVPLWHSDLQCDGSHPTADQLQNGGLFRWAPLHGCGNFGYEPSYAFRSAMTTGNILAASDAKGLSTANPESAEAMRRTVAITKKVRPYMLGDFYPLFPHVSAEDVWYGYQFHRDDLGAGVAIFFRRSASKESRKTIALRGLVQSARYEVENQDTGQKQVLTGKELAAYGLEIAEAPGSAILFYRRVKK